MTFAGFLTSCTRWDESFVVVSTCPKSRLITHLVSCPYFMSNFVPALQYFLLQICGALKFIPSGCTRILISVRVGALNQARDSSRSSVDACRLLHDTSVMSSRRALQDSPLRPTAADIVVREGFICPICMQDLGTILELQDHFEHDHAEEDRSFLQQLKGALFNPLNRKAKREGSPTPNIGNSQPDDQQASTSSQDYFWEAQSVGLVVDHSAFFKKIRDSRLERFMVETNKLVIRLDKLVHEAPSDPRQRAAFEKHLASWVPDHDVPVCPGCGRTFNLLVRKHHCRLCGTVICVDCSHFLAAEFVDVVEKLTNPIGANLPNKGRRGSMNNGTVGLLKRSNSNESLMSVMSAMGRNKEQLVRVCQVCQELLERRMRQMEEKHSKTELEDLHEQLSFSINDAENLYPGYCEMAASLNAGETSYQLAQTAEVKERLNKLFEKIDYLSKKVASLAPSTNVKEQKLRNSIRTNAVEYMKSRVLAMPPLPTPEQYEQLQAKRREEIRQRIAAQKAAEEQRRLAAAARVSREREVPKQPTKSTSKNPFESPPRNPFEEEEEVDAMNPFGSGSDEETGQATSSSKRGQRRTSGGWAPSVRPDDIDVDDDPILQQIDIVKKSIEQAKQEGREDVVQSLTENLKELTLYYRETVVQKL